VKAYGWEGQRGPDGAYRRVHYVKYQPSRGLNASVSQWRDAVVWRAEKYSLQWLEATGRGVQGCTSRTSTLSSRITDLVLLTLCGLTGQKTHRRSLGLGGSVHEEARLCFPCFTQPISLKALEAPTAR